MLVLRAGFGFWLLQFLFIAFLLHLDYIFADSNGDILLSNTLFLSVFEPRSSTTLDCHLSDVLKFSLSSF